MPQAVELGFFYVFCLRKKEKAITSLPSLPFFSVTAIAQVQSCPDSEPPAISNLSQAFPIYNFS
jgi:hypothetical protein